MRLLSITFPAPQSNPKLYERVLFACILAGLFTACVWFTYTYFPVSSEMQPNGGYGFSVDWKNIFRPAALLVIQGKSPYSISVAWNPPWAYLFISPIALLPRNLSAAVMFVLTFFAYGLVLFRMGAKPLALAAFVLNPLVIQNAINGNLDWLAALGLIMPPQIGLLFVLIKPQIGAGIAVFWLVEAWREGGFRKAAATVTPLVVALLVSFLLYGFWPLVLTKAPHDPFNFSLWPLSLPLGAVLLLLAIRKRHRGLAISSSAFLAPYINLSSFAVPILGLDVNSLEFYAAIAILWAMKLLGMY